MKKTIVRYLYIFGGITICVFACIGAILTIGYAANSLGFTKVGGAIDRQSEYFLAQGERATQESDGQNTSLPVQNSYVSEADLYCRFLYLAQKDTSEARHIYSIYIASPYDKALLSRLLTSALYEDRGEADVAKCKESAPRNRTIESLYADIGDGASPFVSADFYIIQTAISKDIDTIRKVALRTGVKERMLLAPLVVEQLRLLNSERESYKKYFYSLKLLGSQTQFSWGIYGMKKETAIRVEKNLKDRTSPMYLGQDYEGLLDFTSDNIEQERFLRITNEKDHYFAYLYAALFLKQLETEWQRAGYDIGDRPEILATLYNLGFEKSVPKENPQVGGAEIQVGKKIYTFGSLAYRFYYSPALSSVFFY